MEFVPEEYLKNNIEGLYQLNTEWQHAIHRIIRKTPIYLHYDLGREYSQIFKPFSTVIFGEVGTVEKREELFDKLIQWLSQIVQKDASVLNKHKEELVRRELVNIKNKDSIDRRWDKFFKNIREILSRIPIINLVYNAEIASTSYYTTTENNYKNDSVLVDRLKKNMNEAWYPVMAMEDSNIDSYEFNSYTWSSMEEILAFLQKRPVRPCPYRVFDTVYAEDFDRSLLKEGIWTQPIPIYNRLFDAVDIEDEEDDEDEEN
jgi:hypothetical protein